MPENEKAFLGKGLATQQDANYIAFKILSEYPEIAKSLALRFPTVIVDEAQDTSSVQMEIFNILLENGLKELMLIGDPDQSIYEWRTAEPELFINKCERWKENSETIKENRRSSQKICDFATKISSHDTIIASNDDVKDYDHTPEIWTYKEDSELPAIKDRFIELCKNKGIQEKNIAILTRGKEMLNEISPGSVKIYGLNPWKDDDIISKAFAASKYYYDNGEYLKSFTIIERELWKYKNDKKICRHKDLKNTWEEVGFTNWRSQLYEKVITLPETNCTIKEWVDQANAVIQAFQDMNGTQLEIKRNSSKCKYQELTFDEVFGRTTINEKEDQMFIGTVHGAKGETYEAVLLILKTKAGKGKNYINLLKDKIQESEELRILYVGITRPRKILAIAVPEQTEKGWKEFFDIK